MDKADRMPASPVDVKPVQSKSDQKLFLNYPWELYRGDPNWIPPIRMNQKELVGFKKHPFHDNARVQPFLAKRNGQVVGRIAAIIDQAHNQHYKEQQGFFGFYESIDDEQVSRQLFDAARDWLRQNGIEKLRGPVNPSLNYECGLLVDGFDSPPTFMMTYNPPYYERLLQSYGFIKAHDLLAFWGHVDMLGSLDDKLRFVTEEAKRRFNVTVRRMNRAKFKEDVQTFLEIYNKSMLNNWGFVPLSERELDSLAKSLEHLIVPELTSIAEVDGKPVAVVFGLLDYNPRVKAIDGKLFPFGFIRLLWNRKAIKKIRVIAANVLPEYQRWGLGLVVLHRLLPDVLNWGIEEAEFSWVLESNKLSKGSLERGGAQLQKVYRIFDLPEDATATPDAADAQVESH